MRKHNFSLLPEQGVTGDFYGATTAKCCLSAHVTSGNCNELQNFQILALDDLGCLQLRRTSLTNANLYCSKHSFLFRSLCLFAAFLSLHSAPQKVVAIRGVLYRTVTVAVEGKGRSGSMKLCFHISTFSYLNIAHSGQSSVALL